MKFSFDQFVEKTNELGLLKDCDNYIEEDQYWTGDPNYDPWVWKDRASGEKKLIYGPFFSGKNGFISPLFYPVFYQAFHPDTAVEQRWETGKLSKMQWDAWQLLKQADTPLGRHELRRMLGVSPKKGGSSLDTALIGLQHTCDIIIAGTRPMLDKNGREYNTSIAYTLLERWASKKWIIPKQKMNHEEALETIYNRAYETSNGIQMDDIKKIFGKQLRNYKKSI